MPEDPNIPQDHITLKEASILSGYAPDYIGQLIRKGKLYGKQVYYKAVWVTTKDAVLAYIKENESKISGTSESKTIAQPIQRLKNWFFSESRLTGIFKILLYCGLIFSISLSLVLFYILSVNIDHALSKRATQYIGSDAK